MDVDNSISTSVPLGKLLLGMEDVFHDDDHGDNGEHDEDDGSVASRINKKVLTLCGVRVGGYLEFLFCLLFDMTACDL